MPTRGEVDPVGVVVKAIDRNRVVGIGKGVKDIKLAYAPDGMAKGLICVGTKVELLRLNGITKPPGGVRADPPLPVSSLARLEVVRGLEDPKVEWICSLDLEKQKVGEPRLAQPYAKRVSVANALPSALGEPLQ